MSVFDDWYDSQPLAIIDRKTEHRLTWEAAVQQQAAEITRLKGVIAKCKDVIQNDYTSFRSYFNARKEVFAAIKEEGL